MSTTKLLITQSNYIPWLGYFDAINKTDIFVYYDQMQYTKRDWRNRNKIKILNDSKWLTIPVLQKNKFDQKIKDVIVADQDWKKSHLSMIKQNYKTAEHFKELIDWVECLYSECTYEHLSDINLHFIRGIIKFLNIKTKIISSSDFKLHEDRNMRLINICKEVAATDYYSGPAAKAYMDENLFAKNGLNVHWLDYSSYPRYDQVNGSFIQGVTIFDLILNLGQKRTIEYMESIK